MASAEEGVRPGADEDPDVVPRRRRTRSGESREFVAKGLANTIRAEEGELLGAGKQGTAGVLLPFVDTQGWRS